MAVIRVLKQLNVVSGVTRQLTDIIRRPLKVLMEKVTIGLPDWDPPPPAAPLPPDQEAVERAMEVINMGSVEEQRAFSKVMGTWRTQANPIRGATVQALTRSGNRMARALGTSSPSTMWSMVMMVNATVTATVWVASGANGSGSQRNKRSVTPARAGSPIQPSPREARVIPSWVAEM